MNQPWTISIPYKSLSDSLIDVGGYALPDPEDRDVLHSLILLAVESAPPGASAVDVLTAGDLLKIVKGIPADRRRHALDVLRTKAGLPTTTEVESKALADSTPAITTVARDLRPIPTCAAEGCDAFPRDPASWTPIPVNVKKWWCPDHADQAAPGDMDSASLPWRFAKSGGIEPVPLSPTSPAGIGWTA